MRRRRNEREYRMELSRKLISDRAFHHILTFFSVIFASGFFYDFFSDGALVIRGKEIPDLIAIVIVIVFIVLAFALVRQSWEELRASKWDL